MQEVWTPSEHMEPGAGFGRPNCAAILFQDMSPMDATYFDKEGRSSSDGKQSSAAYVVVGMHVRHHRLGAASEGSREVTS